MPEAPQLLPQDLEAEQSTLGCILQNPLAVSEVAEVLTADDFFEPKHRRLFVMALEMEQAGTPIDIVTMRDELIKRKIDDFGYTTATIADALSAEIIMAVPSNANARWYSAIVREKAQRRRIIMHGRDLQSRANDLTTRVDEILEHASHSLEEIGSRGAIRGEDDFLMQLQAAFDGLEQRVHLTGVPTGFIELDDILSGLQPGELILIGARPSMGKTAFGLNIALHAMNRDVPTMLFSLEMSKRSIAQRMLCMEGQVNAHLVRRGMHSADDVAKLGEALTRFVGKPLTVDDSSSPTVYQIRNGVRLRSRERRVELVIIDYLQLMKAGRAENRQVAVSDISRELKALARDLNVPVVVLAQLNRQVEGRTDNRPRMSDLRESGALEQDADVVLMLHREEYYNPNKEDTKGLAEIIVAKQRNGPTGTIQLRWNAQWTRFDNLSTDTAADAAYRSYTCHQAPSVPQHATRLPYVEPEDTSASECPI